MAHFIVIHSVETQDMGQNSVIEGFRSVAKAQVPNTTWLDSWGVIDGSKLFCLWEALNEEDIRAALGPENLALLPIQTVYEVVEFSPAFFA